MENIKKIAFATDFSDASKNAKEYAAKLAKQLGASLAIIHVFNGKIMEPGPYHLVAGSMTWMADYISESKKHGQESLKKLCQEMEVEESHFLEGDPRDKLVEFLNNNKDIELLVLGTHGYTGLNKLLIGSVAENVMRSAKCPVVMIKST